MIIYYIKLQKCIFHKGFYLYVAFSFVFIFFTHIQFVTNIIKTSKDTFFTVHCFFNKVPFIY